MEVISLKTFFETGGFGPVRLNLPWDEVREFFGNPKDTAVRDRYMLKNQMDIWKYGNLEFHFFQTKLMLIWCDDLTWLEPGKTLYKLNKLCQLETWFLESSLTLVHIEMQLKQDNISYEVKPDNVLGSCKLFFSSGAYLHFEQQEKSMDWMLIGFGIGTIF